MTIFKDEAEQWAGNPFDLYEDWLNVVYEFLCFTESSSKRFTYFVLHFYEDI